MSDRDGIEQDLFIKNMIRQITKGQLREQCTDKQENNNSYVFLENRTLNLVILYMLMKEERRIFGDIVDEVDRFSESNTKEILEQTIKDHKKEFEEIITSLREKL